MSRSRKRTPSCNVTSPDGQMKAAYNRKLRRQWRPGDELPQGGAYRKMNESWEIRDWREVGTTYGQFASSRRRRDPDAGDGELREEYEKWYRRK